MPPETLGDTILLANELARTKSPLTTILMRKQDIRI
jgi:hypothetical protein